MRIAVDGPIGTFQSRSASFRTIEKQGFYRSTLMSELGAIQISLKKLFSRWKILTILGLFF
jgi:hypothetical protein